MLRLFFRFFIFALFIVSGGLWFLWSPLSSNALEWYLTKQVEKKFGGNFHLEKLIWENGHLLLESPSVTTTNARNIVEKQFSAEQIVVHYEYSLWQRKIHLKLLMKEPSFKVYSAAAILLQTLSNHKSSKYLDWQVSIPHGTLLQGNTKQFPFSLEIADAQGANGHFSLQFLSDSSQSLEGHFFSEISGKKRVHLDFNQIPLLELADALKYVDGPLNKFKVTSGVANGFADIHIEKKQTPSVDAEITFTDIVFKQPTLNFTGNIAKAVLSLSKNQGKLELQGDSNFGNRLSDLQGGIYWENSSIALVKLDGKWADAKAPSKFTLQGKVSPIFTENPLQLDFDLKELQTSIADLHENQFSATFSGSELHFAGSSLLVVKLLPSAIANVLQKQFELDNLTFEGLIKKDGAKCTLDTTFTLNTSKEPLDESFMILFDHGDVRKFLSKKIDSFPFESYCCDIYLAGNLLLKPSKAGHIGISLIAEAFNARISSVQQLLSRFGRFKPLAALPLEGHLALGKSKNCLDLTFTPEGCTFQPSFSGSLSEGKFNGSSHDLTLDDLAFDFTYDHGTKALLFHNLQGALFLGAADKAEEYALAGHSISFNDFQKLQATFDISLKGKEGNLFRLAGRTDRKAHDKERKPVSVLFDKERSHINGMSLTRCELTLNNALHIEHFHLEFPLQLQKLIASSKIISKTKFWHDTGIPDIQEASLDNSSGTLQVEMKYDQKSDVFAFNVKGFDLIFNSHQIEKCILHAKKRGNLWSLEQLKIDRFSIAADLIKENKKWMFNFLGLRWGTALLMGLKGEYLADQRIFKGDINLLELDLNELKNMPKLHSMVAQVQPEGLLRASGKLQIASNCQTNLFLNFSIAKPKISGFSFGEIQQATCDLNIGRSFGAKIELPQKGLFIDITNHSGAVTVDVDRISELMPSEFQKLLSEWKIGKKFNFTGQWQSPFSFTGDLKGENIELNGYEVAHLQANCSYASNQLLFNNLTVQDPAGSLYIDQLSITRNNNQPWTVSTGTCRISDWRPYLMREVGKSPSESEPPLVISRLLIDRLQGTVGDPSSFKGMGEFYFSQQSNRAAQNPFLMIPTEIISRIGLDLSILTPVSGNVFFEIKDNKIVLTKLKDVYSEEKLSKFNLAKSEASYVDFDGNLNLQLRMRHYSLFFKLAELFTFQVTGTVQKPIYAFKKQRR